MKTIPLSLASLLERFFTQRLMQQRQASPHTISSYRDTFRLLLRFVQLRLHTPPAQLAFKVIDTPLIVAFLNHLEKHANHGDVHTSRPGGETRSLGIGGASETALRALQGFGQVNRMARGSHFYVDQKAVKMIYWPGMLEASSA